MPDYSTDLPLGDSQPEETPDYAPKPIVGAADVDLPDAEFDTPVEPVVDPEPDLPSDFDEDLDDDDLIDDDDDGPDDDDLIALVNSLNAEQHATLVRLLNDVTPTPMPEVTLPSN